MSKDVSLISYEKEIEIISKYEHYSANFHNTFGDIHSLHVRLTPLIDTTPAERTEIIEEAKLRMNVYSEFAPKLMDEGEIRTVIDGVLAELELTAPTAKDKGKIMKVLMPKVKGKADGGLVNRILTSYFKG